MQSRVVMEVKQRTFGDGVIVRLEAEGGLEDDKEVVDFGVWEE